MIEVLARRYGGQVHRSTGGPPNPFPGKKNRTPLSLALTDEAREMLAQLVEDSGLSRSNYVEKRIRDDYRQHLTRNK